MTNISKIFHFIFMAVINIIIALFLTELKADYNFNLLIWICIAAIAFALVYFPFNSRAFDFYSLTLKEKLLKYFKRMWILDLVGVIGSVPTLICTMSSQLCVPALAPISLIFLIILIGFVILQIGTIAMILLLHALDRLARKYFIST